MIKELHVFVEGPTDSLFIKEVFNNILCQICDSYTFIEYAVEKDKKINNYIKSIKSVPDWDYIFIADQDGNVDKKNKIMQEYNTLEEDKIFLSIYEIESWILAGISNRIIKKYKINFNHSDTSCITKEKFNKMTPIKLDKLEFISYILSEYNLESAVSLNTSLNEFNQYLHNKKAS